MRGCAMKRILSTRMEIQPSRIVGLLFVLASIPGLVFCFSIICGVVIRSFGSDLTPPDKKLRVGMPTANVRAIMGEPDNIVTLRRDNGTLREDWWYSHDKAMQLTFEADRLVGNHSKDHIRATSVYHEDAFTFVVVLGIFALVTIVSLFSAYMLLRSPRQKSTCQVPISV